MAGIKGNPDIFEDVKTMIEFYRELGIEGIPVKLKEAGKTRSESPSVAPIKKTGVPRREKISGDAAACSDIDKERSLVALRSEIGECVRCKLSKNRQNIVFGEGCAGARLMFIGEGPGKEEDIQGRPFVGDAGQLLTKLIEKMGMKRSDVYIANVVKCRPPMNRDPEEDEVGTCRAFIERQIEIIGPEVIMVLGRIALQTLTDNPKIKITAVRGKFFEFRGIPVMPTFHPAYLLRNPGDKWKTWADAQKVMERLGPA